MTDKSLDALNNTVAIMMRGLINFIQLQPPSFLAFRRQALPNLSAAIKDYLAPIEEGGAVNHRYNAERLEKIVCLIEGLPWGTRDRQPIQSGFEGVERALIRNYGLALRDELGIENAKLIHFGERKRGGQRKWGIEQ